MVYRGQVKDGVLVLEGPKAPPDGARVSVRVLKPRARGAAKAHRGPPTLYDRFKNIIGVVKDLPPDASVNLDHDLYGTPKRTPKPSSATGNRRGIR